MSNLILWDKKTDDVVFEQQVIIKFYVKVVNLPFKIKTDSTVVDLKRAFKKSAEPEWIKMM